MTHPDLCFPSEARGRYFVTLPVKATSKPGMNSSRRSYPLLCLCMAALTACSAPRSSYVWRDLGPQNRNETPKASQEPGNWGAEPESARETDPRIAPGFLLTLRLLEDRSLNGDFRVDIDGNAALPYDVTLNAAGLTLSQVKKKLAELYRPYFKTAAGIDVKVKERSYWIDVRGLVLKPGRFLVDANASLDQVIVAAGGINRESPPQFVRIQKGQKNFSLDLNRYYSRGEAHPQILGWLGGEVLFFQKEVADASDDKARYTPYRLPVYVLGEVRKPGEYLPKNGADFVDFLIQANGFTDRADLDKIEMVRRSGGRTRAYRFSWEEFQRAPPPLQGDLLIVHADARTFEKRFQIVTLLLTTLTSLAIIYELERSNNARR